MISSNKIEKRLLKDFSQQDQALAIEALESITLQHVMAESQINLENTWLAILQLSRGNLSELQRLVIAAKVDFRDVIYWAKI